MSYDGNIGEQPYHKMNKKIEIENVRVSQNNRRIFFTFEDKEYSVNITNEQELRLSAVDGWLVVKPIAGNCLIFKVDSDE